MFQYKCLVFLVFIFTNPFSTAVVDNTSYRCSVDEFRCGDGTCVGLNSICDGIADCVDLSDEGACGGHGDAVLEWNRVKRKASQCRKNQWQCRDGSCIDVDYKCDGDVDCLDGSDERLPLCRKTHSTFKCRSGDVISVVGFCDGAKDCVDGSDETLESCTGNICAGYLFQCAYGACVDQGSVCNGKKDCADGSDETDELCNRISPGVKPVNRPTPTNKPTQGGNCKLPPYPQYGKYIVSNVPGAMPGEFHPSVHLNISCNPGFRVEEMREFIFCYEGSWSNHMPKCVGFCRLNKNPTVEYRCISTGASHSTGSRECGSLEPAGTVVQPICRTPNYYYPGVLSNMICDDGSWNYIAVCQPGFCRLNKNPTVEYRCISTGVITGSRECGSLEPAGTVVQPICRTPNYYYPGVLSDMICDDGSWDYIAVCKPECGTITPLAKPLIIGGRTAKKGELPWHAGIYNKTTKTHYKQICGGSLISTTAVISAAHCFWSDTEKKLPAANYAVAMGKVYRPFNNAKDEGAQTSDVAEIKLTSRYQGAAANYQDDIAIVLVVTPFVYQPYIRPVCINFDVRFDMQQMTPGTMGKVAGWGLTTAKGGASQILKVVEMPVVSIDECRARSPVSFRVHLTSDKICAGYTNGKIYSSGKICAGYTNGTTLCEGDSGGGLAFPAVEQAIERYYLRGVVSVSPVSEVDDECNSGALVAFTQVTKHDHFIKPHL